MDVAACLATEDRMPWTAILTALTLTLTSSYLVFVDGWEIWRAYSVVGGVAIGVCLILLALLLLLSTKDRITVWHSLVETLKRDLRELLDVFGIKNSQKEKPDEN